MMKKIYHFIDFFLPNQLSEFVEIAVLFQARLVVATNLCGLVISTILLIGANVLNMPVIMKIGMLFCSFSLAALVIFLKTRLANIEKYLVFGSTLQILVLNFLIYMIAFSSNGMGYFGLIWLFPVFMMIAFYFKPINSLILFGINLIVFFVVINNFTGTFFQPLSNVPNFQHVYYFYFSLVLILTFIMAHVYVQLAYQLRISIFKQKEVLIESAKFQSLGQMASNLAHDINNPLFNIQGNLHQMRNLLYKDQLDLASCDRIIENVESTILRLSQIVKGISTFARQGKTDQMVSVRVQDLIESVLVIAEDRLKKNGIKLKLDINQNVNVICYPSFISQVLMHLISNAVDTLECEENKIIEIAAFSNEEWVEFHIRDSGKGISKDIEKKIFEPFITTKKFGRETGLGLSISKGLVDVHDGEIYHTIENGMTTFIVRLPSYE